MNNFNICDLILLDNNSEYYVCDRFDYKGREYVYLIDADEPAEVKFCLLDNDSLYEIDTPEVIAELINIVSNNMIKKELLESI